MMELWLWPAFVAQGSSQAVGLLSSKDNGAVFRGDKQMKNAFAPYRRLGIATICAVAVVTIAMGGCNQSTPNNQEIRQKSADATRDLQKGAKQFAADTKVAAANAVNGVNAVAQGVKDGVNSSKQGDTSDLVDINSASTACIAMLPGISISKAHDIVEGRPYRNPHALVGRELLTQEQYDHIADKITAR
jgi:DNA uptake protein ComE-like DNA-binding protein